MNQLKTVTGKIKSFVTDSLVEDAQDNYVIRGWASKPDKDRSNEKVLASAFEKTMPQFMANPIMLYMHNMNTPIGTWTDYQLSAEGLFLRGEIVKGIPQAEYVWTLVKRRVLRGLSIGFMELKGAFDKGENAYVIEELELFETSVVSIPMLQTALITLDGSGKFLNIEPIDHVDSKTTEPTRVFVPGPEPTAGASEENTMTPEQEQKLTETTAAVVALKAELTALTQKFAEQAEAHQALVTKAAEQETQLINATQCIDELVQLLTDSEGSEESAEDQAAA